MTNYESMSVAVIGTGRMGRRHMHAVRKLGLQLVGIVDVAKDALEEARLEHGLSEGVLFDSPASLYRKVIPDCLIIATTADSHCALTCVAAEKGVKYILVEKPMAVSLAQCTLMNVTCRRYDAKLSVNHQIRFMEQFTEPKRLFSTEAYGALASMTVVAGNIGLAMNGSHYFEAFRFLTDEDPIEITAWFSSATVPNPRGKQFEDRAGSVRIVTASGKRLYMEIGADQGHGVRTIYACRNGTITINELAGELYATEREMQYRDLPTTRYGMPAVNTQRSISPAEVTDTSAAMLVSLMEGNNSMSGEQAQQVVAILVAAYQSAESGSVPVRLDQPLPTERMFPWA